MTDNVEQIENVTESNTENTTTNTTEKPDTEIDVEGFQQAWIELKDTHNFFNRLVIGEGLSDIEFGMYGYRANSIEELAIDVTDNKFLFVNCGVYFKWVLKTIKSID